MISHDQIPLIRLSLRRSYKDGTIDREKYDDMLRILAELEERHREMERKASDKIIRNLNRSFQLA